MKEWYKRCRRWFQLNLTEDVCREDNLDFWRAYWSSAPYQGVILNCGGVVGYYQSRYPYQKKARWLGDQDIFGKFSQAAHEDGLAVAARFDVQFIDAAYAGEHPDWFLRGKNGSLSMMGSQAATCINSEYYTRILPMLMEEIIDKYHPQAFTDNSWKANRKTQICYCDACRKAFRDACGEELPEKVDWTDPVYRKWIKWSYQCRVRVWDTLDEAVRAHGGEDCMWTGMFHGDPMDRLSEFIDFHEISKRLRFLFLDHQCRDSGNGMDVEQNSMLGSMYRLMSSEDLLITECTNHYARFGDSGRWFRQASATPAPTLMWEQEGMMGGIAPWVHFFGTQIFDHRREHISGDLLRWHEKNERYLTGRTELADIAVVWSQENGDFYGRDHCEEIGIAPWLGMRHALMKEGIPFLPINIHDIAKHGCRVKTLVLPDLAAVDDEDARGIIDFVERGGNLVLTGKAALLDGEGEMRETSPLWDVLGLVHKGCIGSALDRNETADIVVTDESIRRATGVRRMRTAAMTQIVESRGCLKCAACAADHGKTGVIFTGETEAGGRIAYLACDADREYAMTEGQDCRRLLIGLIDWTLKGERIVEVESAGSLSVKLHAQGDRWILHLNNVTGSDLYGGMQNEFIPVPHVRVRLRYSAHPDPRVYRAVKEEYVTARRDKDIIEFELDRIVDHEMLIVE